MITYNMPSRDATGTLSPPVIEAVEKGAVSANVDVDTISLTFSTKKAAAAFIAALDNPEKLGVVLAASEAPPVDPAQDGDQGVE